MRRFAQHFLTNLHAIERIVATLELTQEDAVFEIGPGKGALTMLLIQQAGSVVAVEVDDPLIEFLKIKFKFTPKFTVIHSDIMKLDLKSLPSKHFKVVGNLPYNLTSPILRLLCEWDAWSTAVVMVQKEVGERLVAPVGSTDYGALTVGVNLNCKVEPVFILSETSFSPAPRVKSMVLKLTRRETPLTNNVPLTQKVVQAAFQQRRKTILNSLSHGLNMTKAEVQVLLQELDVDPGDRAENVSIDQFVNMSRLVSTKLTK